MLALIVAVAHSRVIGKDNTLIWHLPNDLKFFKEKTTGHVIIMGRKTFESLPFLLPNREHWVITRDKGFDAPEGVRVFHNPEEAAEALKPSIKNGWKRQRSLATSRLTVCFMN